MSELDASTLPLQAVYDSNLAIEVLAQEIGARFQNGREDEVSAFLRACDTKILHELSWLEPEVAAWQRDAGLWLQLARLTAVRGALWREAPEDARQRDPAFSHELRAMAETWLAAPENRGLAPKDVNYFVLTQVIYRLYYPGMPREEALDLIEWTLSLRRASGIQDDADYNCGWGALIESLSEPADLIAIAGMAGRLCVEALQAYVHKTYMLPASERWLPWHAFFKSHADRLDEYHAVVSDPALLAWRWRDVAKSQRIKLADSLLSDLPDELGDDQNVFFETLDRLIRDDETVFTILLQERKYRMTAPLAALIWDKQYPKLLPMLLPLIVAQSYSLAPYATPLSGLLDAQPDTLASVPAASLDRVLLALDVQTLRKLLPALTPVLSNSSSKSLREAMVKAARQLSPADISAAGWLAVRNKNLRLVCRDILLTHPDTITAAPLLAGMLASGAFDPASASTVAARLEELGVIAAPAPGEAAKSATPGKPTGTASAPEAAPGNALAALEAQAAGVKRISASIKHFDTPQTLALLQPLSEHGARVVFHLAATAEAALPPLAHTLLAQLAPENHARLAQALVEGWIAAEGEPKQRWALKLLGAGADDRIVDLLTDAVYAWGKLKKQRAVVAVEQLGALDTLYALARVQEISDSRKVKEMVIEAAHTALRAAATRRTLGVAELLDELTPDFGLSQGVTLSVGAQRYQLVLQGDLSLRVVDAKGKASKSLPANKDAALHDAWEAASNQFKTLSAGLKAIVKQQAPRMQAALVVGKTWPAERWQRLFLHHPLLRVMGRSLIWQVADTDSHSFRIAEDFSLLDLDDTVLTLPEQALIRLWHPVHAKAGEVQAWQTSLAEYELEALIDQTGAPADLPPPEAMNGEALLAPAGLKVAQEQLAGVLKKSGYRQGPVGDGPSIEWHEWPLPAAQLVARLNHGFFPPYMELGNPISVEAIQVWQVDGHARSVQATATLPKPLLASLWQHLHSMAAKRIV